MKTAYIKAPFQVEFREVPLRELKDNELLVRVELCGICGSDIHSARSQAVDWETFGHEVVGVVERVGRSVGNVKAGDRVVLESSTFCRTCDDCRNGDVYLCKDGPNNFFTSEPGGFSEYFIAAMEQAIPLDPAINPKHAALVEPMGVAMDLFKVADIHLNDDVLVIGLGAIGLMALRMAKLAGARNLYAADIEAAGQRFEVAKAYGATELIRSDRVSLEEYPFPRGGVDRVLVTAPPWLIPTALKTLRFGGIAAYLGFGYGPRKDITIDANEFHLRRLQLRASYAAPALFFPRCLDLIRSGMIDCEPLITDVRPMDQLEAAIRNQAENIGGCIKTLMYNPCGKALIE